MEIDRFLKIKFVSLDFWQKNGVPAEKVWIPLYRKWTNDHEMELAL